MRVREKNSRLSLLSSSDLIEFLHKKRLSRKDALLLIMCVNIEQPKEVTEIKRIAREAGLTEIQKWNVSAILGGSKGLAIRLPDGWAITSTGKEHIRNTGVLPQKKARKGYILQPLFDKQ